jgi:uracil-DNA glycosylase
MSLWEEEVPLLKEKYHLKIRDLAYGEASRGQAVYPPPALVFQAMRLVPFDEVRVVILGQDPYINSHRGVPEAHGLCFSVQDGIPIPPSLQNIFKEIQQSIYNGVPQNFSTDLSRWARQGVLLLNASLTVISKNSNSHANLGWHKLTDNIIETLSRKRENLVFLLWGAFAQKKEALIDQSRHLILKTSHPSPLSAHRGFLGSGVFVKCNEYLRKNGQEPIRW